MTLDKAIKHKKEHRKAYRGAKAVDSTCRNHGSDIWSLRDRTNKYIRKKEEWQDKLDEYINNN